MTSLRILAVLGLMLLLPAAIASAHALPAPSSDLMARLETIYKDLHANPELSMQEQRTAKIAADVRDNVLSAIKRIINAEATASRSPTPPAFKVVGEFPLTSNDEGATRTVTEALTARFGKSVQRGSPATASEDFSVFARTWNAPLVFWLLGGTDPRKYAEADKAGRLNELPSNHSPQFAPVLDPTLRVGIEAMLTAAGPWLAITAKP